jgi:hypothetical protein
MANDKKTLTRKKKSTKIKKTSPKGKAIKKKERK